MLNRLIRLSIRDRLVVILLAISIIAGSWFLVRETPIDVLPDISAPSVTVLTEAPGMAAEEVEQLVTLPLETQLIGADGVRRVYSNSIQGFSSISVEFDWDTEVYDARQIVSERLQGSAAQLPDGVESPILAPITSIMGEIMMVGLTADETSLMDLRSHADWTVRRQLLSVPGIADVYVFGGEQKEYSVELDPVVLDELDIPIDEVSDAIAESNFNASGGYLQHSGKLYTIRGMGRLQSGDRLGEIKISESDESSILLHDVAQISERPAPRMGDASINTEQGIAFVISKQPDADTMELTEQVEKELEALSATLPDDITIHPELFQQAHFIQIAIDNVVDALLIAGFLVIIILFLFLNNWRPTLISLTAVPVSLMITALILHLSGFTINTMTLGGMAIAIGVLVDDAIVYVENVYRRLQENIQKPEIQQTSALQVIRDASIEIKGPIVLANFIIVVVFLPFFFLSGLEGRLLVPLGLAYVIAIAASLLIALTLTPSMSSVLLRSREVVLSKPSRLTIWLDRGYRKVLHVCLRVRMLVISIVVFLFIIALASLPFLGRSFLPEFNEGTLNVGLATLPGTSLEESNRLGNALEEILLDHREVKSTVRRTGRAQWDEHTMGTHGHELEVRLEEGADMQELQEELREKLQVLPGANISLDQPITHRIDHMLTGVRTNLAVKIYGTDLGRMQDISREIEREMAAIGNFEDVLTEQQQDIPQLRIYPDREAINQNGVSMQQFRQTIETAYFGQRPTQLLMDGALYDVAMRFGEEYQQSPEELRQTPVRRSDGGLLRISDLADVRVEYASESIERENANRMVITQANITGGDLAGTVDELQERVSENVDLSGGYVVNYEGQFEQQQEATRVLLLVSIISLFLIFIALYLQFRSVGQSLLILINLPLALIGGIVVIWFTDGIISIASMVGFITLFGIAVRNGIILVSQYNDLINTHGFNIREAVVQGSLNRLRPIVMTAITTALALIPLVWYAGQPGNEFQAPMASVILGGLVTATLLNLIVVPVVFDRFYGTLFEIKEEEEV